MKREIVANIEDLKKLSLDEAHKEIIKLTEKVNYHNNLYYVLDEAEITDEMYDMMSRKLIALEKLFLSLNK